MSKLKILKLINKIYSTPQIYLSTSFFILFLITLKRISVPNSITAILLLLGTMFTHLIFIKIKFSKAANKINKKFSPWIFSLSALLSLFTANHIFNNANLILGNFADRIIGIAVFEGVDVAARSFLYIELVAVSIIVFLLTFFIFSKIDHLIDRLNTKNNLKNERDLLFTFSLSSLFLLIFHYLNGTEIFINIFDILVFLTFLSYLLLLATIFFEKVDKRFSLLLTNGDLQVLSFLFPLVIFFTRWAFVNGSFTFNYGYFYPYFPLWIAFWVFIRLFVWHSSQEVTQSRVYSVLSAGIPMLAIPVSISLSNEIQYTLSNVLPWSAHRFATISTFFLIGTSAIFYFINRRSQSKTKFAQNYFLPILVATVVMFNSHTNFIETPRGFDMFHNGENLIATQQLFSFQKIPFVNIFPTHGISYMVGQTLYSMINGYRPFEPWLWEWITKIFEVVLLYFVLSKITNPIFSAVTIIFIPFIGIFGGQHFTYGYNTYLASTYYFTSFLAGLTLVWVLKKPNFLRLTILWLASVFLLTWRADFGIASFASILFILLTVLLYRKLNSIKTKLKLKNVLFSLVLVIAFTLLLIITLSVANKESFIEILRLNYEFVKFQALAQGLLTIANSFSPMSVFQYLILPSISIFYILVFIFRLFIRKDTHFAGFKYLLLFLAIFSLIISIRSVQRQTLVVLGYNSYLFVFLAICIPFYLNEGKKEISTFLFIAILLAYQFILPNNTLLVKSGPLIDKYSWKNKESRVRVNDSQYKILKTFLNNNLDDDQTFLDLTSSPLLYVVSNRKFINYFTPNAYYTSELIQGSVLEKIEKAYKNGEIPIVIFRQPDTNANNIDGVPNEIRSYRIYEYIYKNYKAAGYVNGYMIWVSNNFTLKNTNGLTVNKSFIQDFNLKKLPYIWGTYDNLRAKEKTVILSSLINGPEVLSPTKDAVLSFDKNLDKSSGNYIHLRVQNDNQGTLKIVYGQSPQSTIAMDLITSNKPIDYLIRISSQYSWTNQNTNSIKIYTSTKINLVQAFIRKGD